jgi:hypothetical protein
MPETGRRMDAFMLPCIHGSRDYAIVGASVLGFWYDVVCFPLALLLSYPAYMYRCACHGLRT